MNSAQFHCFASDSLATEFTFLQNFNAIWFSSPLIPSAQSIALFDGADIHEISPLQIVNASITVEQLSSTSDNGSALRPMRADATRWKSDSDTMRRLGKGELPKSLVPN